MPVRAFLFLSSLFSFSVSCSHLGWQTSSWHEKSSSVIFFHPDGMSLSHWDLGRLITEGPDGLTSWDQMPHIAVYKAHLKNNLVASSQAGATIHAYGKKADLLSFGKIGGRVGGKIGGKSDKSNLDQNSNSENPLQANFHSPAKKENLSSAKTNLQKKSLSPSVSHHQNQLSESLTASDKQAVAQDKQPSHPISLLKEAQRRGFKTGLLQSGHLMEPGTAVFASSAKSRKLFHEITVQLVYSNVDILLSGGEKYLLPKGLKGRFGEGVRTDKRNLIKEAEEQGYFVVYTLEELKKSPQTAKKIFGVFAHDNTYNDESEEVLIQKGLKAYDESAPSIAEMSKYALEFLTRGKEPFFLVVEEEGTDNFSNKNNAEALFIAIKRSLKALDFFRAFLKKNKDTLLIVASDSNASSPALIDRFSSKKLFTKDQVLPSQTPNGSPLDKKSDGRPFLSKPDKKGLQMPFAISWPTKMDVGTGIVVKAEGHQAHKIKGVLDNTELYHIMRQTLFK